MRALILTAALLVAAGPTSAAMPDYDVKASCRQVAEAGGSFSHMIYGGCLTQEQAAFNRLNAKWDSLPSEIRRSCDEVARMGSGSFTILEGCANQELNAAEKNKSFEFQRSDRPGAPALEQNDRILPKVHRGGQ